MTQFRPIIGICCFLGVALGLTAYELVFGGRGEQFLPLTLPVSQKIASELSGTQIDKPVIIFSAGWCHVCRSLEAELDKRGVSYVRAAVDTDKRAKEFFFYVTYGRAGAVPLTIVGDRYFVGYQPNRIQGALNAL